MKSEKLYDAITGISDKYVEEAVKPRKKVKLKPWMPALAGAACVAIIIGAVGLSGSGVPKADEPADAAPQDAPAGDAFGDYIGHNESYTFMSYGGPVFPMTLLEEDETITADRHITYDIAYNTETAYIEDAYTLTNSSDEDKTVTAVYPFNGSLWELKSQMPKIIVGEDMIEPNVYEGTYSGKFIGILGSEGAEEGGSHNLSPLNSWEGYKDLLLDGSYMANAFGEMRDLDQEVIVYKFTNHKSTGEYSANLCIDFDIDREKTKILTLNTNGYGETEDHATCFYSLTHAAWDDYAVYIIVLGEDIKNCTTRGMLGGEKELPGATADMERYETTFGEVIKEYIENEWYKKYFAENVADVPEELYYRAFCALMYKYGPMSTGAVQRYSDGRLDDMLLETLLQGRVFYLSFDVTIPAGESAEIFARFTKEASYDYDCCGGEASGLRGYDMVTVLGSNLNYAEQKATVKDTGNFEIVRNNFGFDLEKGINTVTLDPGNEHYYMEVRKIEAEQGK